MEAVGNNDGTLLAILIIGVIILIVSVRLGLPARLLKIFGSRPGLPGTDQNNLTPAQMTPVDNVSAADLHKANINGDGRGDACISDLATSQRAEKTGGVNIAGGTINISGDVVGGNKITTLDFTESAPISCPACGRNYVPADSQYACPNCGTAAPINLIQSS